MLKLIDERLNNKVVIEGLENIIYYLGDNFKNCKDHYDINEILENENCGCAGYKVINEG